MSEILMHTSSFLHPWPWNDELKTVPRASHEQRSEATRERLIKATLECILEKGFANTTTAEISARAGVSSGARVHHFKAKLDLVIAAAVHIYEQATVDSLEAAARASTLKDPLRAYITDAYEFFSGPSFLMQHELVNAARTCDELMQAIRPAGNAFRETIDAAWLDVLVKAGHSRQWAITVMELSVVMIRGLALGSLLRGRARDAEILKLWKTVISQHPDKRKHK
jgi:AcrR family transcriptional regulator